MFKAASNHLKFDNISFISYAQLGCFEAGWALGSLHWFSLSLLFSNKVIGELFVGLLLVIGSDPGGGD